MVELMKQILIHGVKLGRNYLLNEKAIETDGINDYHW